MTLEQKIVFLEKALKLATEKFDVVRRETQIGEDTDYELVLTTRIQVDGMIDAEKLLEILSDYDKYATLFSIHKSNTHEP
jgi:hypothetical protein